jgi:hypothetical protein
VAENSTTTAINNDHHQQRSPSKAITINNDHWNVAMAAYLHLPRKAASTENGYRTAQGHWNAFLETKGFRGGHYPEMEEVTSILNEFATYMVKNARKADGEPYSLGFILQVLSGVKEMMRKRNPAWSIWQTHTGRSFGQNYGWYDEIRYAITKAVVSETFDSGDQIKENNIPIGKLFFCSFVSLFLLSLI